ncbi:MAG: beta-galactosidase [Anaerolineae bacterium]
MRKQNPSLLNRIPLPVLVGGWLALVVIGAVLVFAVFFNQPTGPKTATPIAANPTQATGSNQPSAPQQPAAQPTQAAPQQPSQPTQPAQPAQPVATVDPRFGPDGLLPELPFGYGVQVNGIVGDPAVSIDLVDRLHARWIKQQVQWGVFEHEQGKMDFSGFDGIINAAHANGVRVMLSIVTAPQWTHPNLPASNPPGENDPDAIKGPPDDPQAFANFVGQVIDRYKGKIQAIEVWNEQNLIREWRTTPQLIDAKRYVDLLRVTYQVIKQRDPSIIVISGALSPTGVDDPASAIDDFKYLQQMLDAGLLDTVDCVGAHHNGYNIGPNVSSADSPALPKAATALFRGPFDNSKGAPHHSWFFKETLQGYNSILKGQKPLCVTEFGWASSEEYGAYPPGFEFAADNTVAEQGQNIVEAYQLMQQWGFVKLAFLWNLDYGVKGKGPTDDPVPYSLIKTDGSKRASWDPVRLYLKQVTGDN